MIELDKLEEILPKSRLDQLALKWRTDKKNHVKLPGKTVLLTLLHGVLHHPDISQRLLEQTYRQLTSQTIDHSTFGKRLDAIPVPFFADVFHQTRRALEHGSVTYKPDQQSLLRQRAALHSLKLRVVDSTNVTLSAKLLKFGLLFRTRHAGKESRYVKSVVELRDGLPNLLRLCRDQSDCSDASALGGSMAETGEAGDVWIFDKGCSGREKLLAIHRSGAFFVTPHGSQGLKTHDVLWRAQETPKAFSGETAPAAGDTILRSVERAVFFNNCVTENRRFASLPLVVVRLSRFDGRSKTYKPLTLLTNLPVSESGDGAGPFDWEQIAQLYRSRWEIETFFKLLKQHLSYGHLLSRGENGIEAMIYVGLIAALLMIWYRERSGLDCGWRGVKSWLAFDVNRWLMEDLRSAFSPPNLPPRLDQPLRN